jgi:GxxExxY protein
MRSNTTRYYEKLPDQVEKLATDVVDAAFKVHKSLGPGLLESVYEACLTHELRLRGHQVRTQVPVPITYEGVTLDAALRIDVLIDDQLIVELKAVDALLPVYEAQLLTYLKLTGKRLGLLINFNVPVIRNGIRRIIL